MSSTQIPGSESAARPEFCRLRAYHSNREQQEAFDVVVEAPAGGEASSRGPCHREGRHRGPER